MTQKKNKYLISQAELWHRNFLVAADSKKEALQRYKNYCRDGLEEEHGIEYIYEPEYIDEISEDIIIEVYEDESSVI